MLERDELMLSLLEECLETKDILRLRGSGGGGMVVASRLDVFARTTKRMGSSGIFSSVRRAMGLVTVTDALKDVQCYCCFLPRRR